LITAKGAGAGPYPCLLESLLAFIAPMGIPQEQLCFVFFVGIFILFQGRPPLTNLFEWLFH